MRMVVMTDQVIMVMIMTMIMVMIMVMIRERFA